MDGVTAPDPGLSAESTRCRPLRTVAIGSVAIGAVLGLCVVLARVRPRLPRVLGSYDELQSGAYSSVLAFLRWCLSDMTQANFFTATLGGVGMLLGGVLAHVGRTRGRARAGFAIAYDTGLWPWVCGAATLGVVLSVAAWGWTIPLTGKRQPTFVPFVSIPPAVVLLYGPGWKVAVTGAVLGALLTTPIAVLLFAVVCYPLGFPTVTASVMSMWVSAVPAFLLCRRLPWLPRPPTPAAGRKVTVGPPRRSTSSWYVRRVLADFTEAQFFGNELASGGLLLGTLVSFVLNPASVAYGSGLFPAILAAQALTGTLAVLLYRRQWTRHAWYPTFVPMVSLAPAAVLTVGTGVDVIVSAAALGAVAGPPVAAAVARRLPPDFHPFIGNVFSMSVITAAGLPCLALLR